MAESTYNYDGFDPRDYNLASLPGPKIGEPAINFTLNDSQGRTRKLSEFRGKKVVLETGSKTCPIYVKDIRSMNALKNRFSDVVFLTLYVGEAHPGERQNAHGSHEEKTRCANNLKSDGEHRITLVDDLDGRVHKIYGALPNMVYIIDESGDVVSRSNWSDPTIVDCFLSGRLPEQELKIDLRMPNRPTLLMMLKVLFRGGWIGLWDFFYIDFARDSRSQECG